MKFSLLTIASFCVLNLNAQTLNSDLSSNSSDTDQTKPVHYNNFEKDFAVTGNTLLPCDSGSTILGVTGACTYNWYSDSLATNLLESNNDLNTGVIYSSQSYYLQVMEGQDSGIMGLPPHSSTFGSDVRGYYFTAPVDFTITALTVPTDANTGTSNIAVIKLNALPPEFSTTTNDFTTMGYWPQSVDDTIYTCLNINAGDIIGILGNRGDQNSYGAGAFTTDIGGYSVDIDRLGMQFPLSTTSPQDVFTEVAGNISRVFFEYETNYQSVMTEVNVEVPSVDVSVSNNLGIFTANLAGAQYEWVDCNNGNSTIPGENGQSFTPTSNGSYAVIIDDGVCSGMSECITINDVSLPEHASIQFDQYPNPTSGKVTLNSSQNLQNGSITITDVKGKIVFSQENQKGDLFKIDLSTFENGTYIIRILGDNCNYKSIIVKN